MTHHPDIYGKRASVIPMRGEVATAAQPQHSFGIRDLNDEQPAPTFLTERRDRALRAVEADLSQFIDETNQEARMAEQEPEDPVDQVKELLGGLPTLRAIDVARGIIATGEAFLSEVRAAIGAEKEAGK